MASMDLLLSKSPLVIYLTRYLLTMVEVEELDEHLICERGQDAWARMLREFGGEYRAIASLAPAAFHDDDDDGDEEPDLPIII